jgi:hypothetical protein
LQAPDPDHAQATVGLDHQHLFGRGLVGQLFRRWPTRPPRPA